MNARPARLDIYRTAIPMRGFEHAAARRSLAEAVVVRLELADGRAGWGETLPRPYVTGETLDSVVVDLETEIWPRFCIAPVAPLPEQIEGRIVTAAACALDIARADATALVCTTRHRLAARVTGVLGSADPARTARRLRLMRWFGLRDFKLKLGFDDDVDAANLQAVHRQIGTAVAAGRCTLRVDVNGGWSADSTPRRVAELRPFGVCVVEQPVYCPAEELLALSRRCELPLMADESLLTEADARTLAVEPQRVWWNLRLSKNGGLSRVVSLARLAGQHGVPYTLGCMVGESSILSAAQRRALELLCREGQETPPRFVEGNYGRLLLGDDLTKRSLRFGYGGRLRPLDGPGLGISVLPDRVERYGRLVRSLAPRETRGGD